MGTFILRRVIQAIPIIIGVSVISFLIIYLAPGEPTDRFRSGRVSQETIENLTPERFVGLASAAKGRIGPTPRRSYKPWVLVAAGITAFVVVAWWLRRRSAAGASVEYGTPATDTYRSPGEPPASVAGN